MSNITKFRYPDKNPADPLLASDPMPKHLKKKSRLIYLRIINESESGILLQCDRLAVEMAARITAQAISGNCDNECIENLENIYEAIMQPELGQEYIDKILSDRNATK